MGTGPYFDVYEFEKTEFYYEQFHLAHGVDLTSACPVDLHWCMDSAEDVKAVKVKLSVWLLYTGLSMGTLTDTPDAAYTWTLEPENVATKFASAYVTGAIDLTALAASKDVHSHVAVKLERLDAGDGDTHGGGLWILRGEIFFPLGTGEMIAGI